MRRMKSSFSAALIRKATHGLAVLSVPPLHSRKYLRTEQACTWAFWGMADEGIAMALLLFFLMSLLFGRLDDRSCCNWRAPNRLSQAPQK